MVFHSGETVWIVADYELKSSGVSPSEVTFSVLFNGQPPTRPFFATYFDFRQIANEVSKDLSEKERQDLIEDGKALLELAGGRVVSFIPADSICSENDWLFRITRHQEQSSGCLQFNEESLPDLPVALTFDIVGLRRGSRGEYVINKDEPIRIRVLAHRSSRGKEAVFHQHPPSRVELFLALEDGPSVRVLLGPSPLTDEPSYFRILSDGQQSDLLHEIEWDLTDKTGTAPLPNGRYYIVALVHVELADESGSEPFREELLAALQEIELER